MGWGRRLGLRRARPETKGILLRHVASCRRWPDAVEDLVVDAVSVVGGAL
ncbi:hypothetical protein OG948_38625 (plasmid) [Embleya sp. NBC_00888]|nr:hypothetical protein OG948_38625 [Embleya sp. NBC_00888]